MDVIDDSSNYPIYEDLSTKPTRAKYIRVMLKAILARDSQPEENGIITRGNGCDGGNRNLFQLECFHFYSCVF